MEYVIDTIDKQGRNTIFSCITKNCLFTMVIKIPFYWQIFYLDAKVVVIIKYFNIYLSFYTREIFSYRNKIE